MTNMNTPTAEEMPAGAPATRMPKKRGRSFPPCGACGANSGFNWNCPCGFTRCHACVEQEMATMRWNGRQWVCPTCGKLHIGPNR
jgi:hypothetical protein